MPYEQEPEEAIINVTGALKRTEKGYRLMYSESGEEEDNAVNILITGKKVNIIRTGPLASILTVEDGVIHMFRYNTEYGTLMLSVKGISVKNNVTDKGGSLFLRYVIMTDSEYMTENEIQIYIKEYENE